METAPPPTRDVLDGLQARLLARMKHTGLLLPCSPAEFGEWTAATLGRLAAVPEDRYRMSGTGGTYAEDVPLGSVSMNVELKVFISSGDMKMTIRHTMGDTGIDIPVDYVHAAATVVAEVCKRRVISSRIHKSKFELEICRP